MKEGRGRLQVVDAADAASVMDGVVAPRVGTWGLLGDYRGEEIERGVRGVCLPAAVEGADEFTAMMRVRSKRRGALFVEFPKWLCSL